MIGFVLSGFCWLTTSKLGTVFLGGCHAYKCMQECFGKIKRYIQSREKKGLRYTVSGYTVPFRVLFIPAGSLENLSRREVVLENLESRSPTHRGHFDHLNEEPNKKSNVEQNEEPKHEPNKEPKLEPNEDTVVDVGVVELGSDANDETFVEVGIEELGSDANEEIVVEVGQEQVKARRARKRGFACRSPYTEDIGRRKKNVSASRPLIMIPQDYTGFALQSYVGKGKGFPMYYIRRDAIIEQYHRYSGRYRMCWLFCQTNVIVT
ncbi:hypothetical protein LXL04_039717 [Taraxacum kok-saghyz]